MSVNNNLVFIIRLLGVIFFFLTALTNNSYATSSTNYVLKNYNFGYTDETVATSAGYSLTISLDDLPPGLFIVNDETSSNSESAGSKDFNCDDQTPGLRRPLIYAATPKSSSTLLLQFDPADEPVEYYEMQFGTSSGNYQWGATLIGDRETRSYMVTNLNMWTTYYFRVRAGNGCAAGAWSNEISASTRSFFGFNNMEIVSNDVVKSPSTVVQTPDAQESSSSARSVDQYTGAVELYEVKISVQDQNNQAVSDVDVTISYGTQTAKTNADGKVSFNNIPAGEHGLELSYKGFKSRQTIYLENNIELTVKIETPKQNNMILRPLALFTSIFLIVFILVSIFLNKKRSKQNRSG